jgi:hypothetical protein
VGLLREDGSIGGRTLTADLGVAGGAVADGGGSDSPPKPAGGLHATFSRELVNL